MSDYKKYVSLYLQGRDEAIPGGYDVEAGIKMVVDAVRAEVQPDLSALRMELQKLDEERSRRTGVMMTTEERDALLNVILTAQALVETPAGRDGSERTR